jgi:hypothetical protein
MTAADRCTWPMPSPADTALALEDMSGDIARGLPPKADDVLIVLAAARAADTIPDPDAPVPFILTSKARALLDQVPDGQWVCEQCGAAWFGAVPDDGLCPACRLAMEHP